MGLCGYLETGLFGGICLKNTVTGIVSIKDILDGGRKGFGIH